MQMVYWVHTTHLYMNPLIALWQQVHKGSASGPEEELESRVGALLGDQAVWTNSLKGAWLLPPLSPRLSEKKTCSSWLQPIVTRSPSSSTYWILRGWFHKTRVIFAAFFIHVLDFFQFSIT